MNILTVICYFSVFLPLLGLTKAQYFFLIHLTNLSLFFAGITQDEIDTARSAEERFIMEDVTRLVESGEDLCAKDGHGATAVSTILP